jgi:Ni/Co efflux regulator RcnB
MKTAVTGAIVIALLTSSPTFADPGNGHSNGHGRGNGHGQGNNHGQDDNYGQDNNRGRGNHQAYRHDNGRHLGWARDRGNQYRWSRGERMGYNDWNSAQRVDYRRYHLNAPPRGYEWRRQDNSFILAAIATGLIASIILSSGR